MSFEHTLNELRRQKPFQVDDVSDICKILGDNPDTRQYVKQIWLACQLSNSLGFSISTINEFQQEGAIDYDGDKPFYAVCVSQDKNSYCFSVPDNATLKYVALQALERVVKYTGTRIEKPQLRFWNEPILDEESGEAQYIRELHGAQLNAPEDLLHFEIFDSTVQNHDIIFCHILWDFTQITAKMKISDTVFDLLCSATDLIERKNGIKLDAVSAKDQVFFMDTETPLDSNMTLESLQPEFDGPGFRNISLVVKSQNEKITQTGTPEYFYDLESDLYEAKDGYHVHMLWDKCQVDYQVSPGASLIDALKKARDLIEERRKLDFQLEDAWDNIFYRGERIEDTRTLLKTLPGAVANDPENPIHLAVHMSVQTGKTNCEKQSEFLAEMEERNKTGPLYYCHVFWHKSFVSVQLPKSSTCLDLLEAAKESLCTKQDEDRDVESASSRLAYNGYIITDVSCKIEELPGAIETTNQGGGLHFSVEEATPLAGPSDLCYFCSLMWRREGKDEEFLVFKLTPTASCMEILQKLKEKRKDFSIEKDGMNYLWLNHTELVTDPRTTKVSELKGAHLCPEGDTNFDDASKSLHFLIDVDKKEPVEIIPEQPKEATPVAAVEPGAGAGEEEELEVFKPNNFIDEFDEPSEYTVSNRSASSTSHGVKDPDLTNDDIDRLSRILTTKENHAQIDKSSPASPI